MDEVLEKFLEDQKMKIAEEKACLEQELPYMEMRRRTGHVLQKENIPPRTSQQDGVSLPLGEEYERKKHKLQEELRKDYRKYMAEKDHWDAGDIHTVPERRRIPRTVRVRHVATLTDVCGLGWGVCSSEEDCSDEELMLLQGRRHQKERDIRTANRREEVYTETGHHISKLQHRNRMSTSVATQANERSVSAASQDTVCTTGLLIGETDLEVTQKMRKERYRYPCKSTVFRDKELDLRVPRVTDADKKQLFASEASAYRKQPRDDITRLDTAEPPEGLLQYRTDPLSPCRMPFVPTHLPFLADAYKPRNNDSESLPSPSRAYGPIAEVSFPASSAEPHPLSPHEHSRNIHRPFLGENEGVGSGLSVFPAHHAQKNRLSYKEELRKQIEERAAQRRVDREEKRRLDAELEADMRAYEPWGRGGAGAPLRDSTGNLITDLKQMHLLNAAAGAQRTERPGFVETHTPQFSRGNVFNQMLSPQQLLEKDQYKACLRLQMEEKRRKQAEERERMKAEEEREDRRLAEQREKIRREYEEEQENRKRREMEQKLKNEELARLAEERRRDAEKKKKEEEKEKERAALQKQEERERQIRLQQVQRAPSPPIPTLQNKHRNPSNAIDFSPFRAPPSPEHRNHQRTEKDRSEVFNELSVLRRRLRSEQRRLEEQLLHTEWEPLPSPFTDRSRVDVFDMARLRMPVRGPSSRGTEPISSKKTDDIMYRDAFMLLPRTRQSRNRDVEGGRGSVLLSESEFIDQNGVAFPLPPDVERKSAKPSARERRRLANLQAAEKQPMHQQSFSMRKLRDTNTLRMKRSQAFGHHTTAGGCSDDEDEDGRRDERFTLPSPGRPSSIDTAATEPWIRAESSDTLIRLMSGSEH
ncbi:centrosome and spindle pole-associated protein 1 isoform X2 [Megalobrama amblycephala]|uniref:centrosome and spindle pole-associated protein 1 isoform X2 n=1 Tax=Megalobrama amblycephala TaxID=75352 RepID=UPI0020140D9A|nr:centrosome and spindle pole-associated protein 1 isoform X2 [Megalobrama amblycephala]